MLPLQLSVTMGGEMPFAADAWSKFQIDKRALQIVAFATPHILKANRRPNRRVTGRIVQRSG